jgi:DNA helicase HerA-like ATPase
MSATVLSQCNTFLLHRIVNDRDQDLVRRLVPDAFGDLLRELPSLPSRRAILLGWGAPAPVLVEIRELPEKQRPHSPDPDFWNVWTGERPCSVDWRTIADSWASMGGRTMRPRKVWKQVRVKQASASGDAGVHLNRWGCN